MSYCGKWWSEGKPLPRWNMKHRMCLVRVPVELRDRATTAYPCFGLGVKIYILAVWLSLEYSDDRIKFRNNAHKKLLRGTVTR